MTTTKICEIVDQLRIEENDLKEKLDGLKQETRSVETELSRIRKAIGALKPKSGPSEQGQKPTASKEQILEIASAILAAGPQAQSELKKRVATEVASTGKSLTGFAMRFKNVLKDERFAQFDDQVQLSESSQPQCD